MSDLTIHTFWEQCNERGWFDLRRKLLDHRLSKNYGRAYCTEDQVSSSLDELLRENRSQWIDHLIGEYLKSGFSAAEIMRIISKWLARQETFAALQLAAMAVVHAGRRADLQMLTVGIEPKDVADALRVDTAFAVRRRSLS